jgi:hypothetical protein
MIIGKLYKVKKYFWLMFPTKQTAARCDRCTADATDAAACSAGNVCELKSSYWSKQLNCEVIYFSPDSYIVYFGKDGVYKNVLTSDGKIGWTWFIESYNDCFEEVETE